MAEKEMNLDEWEFIPADVGILDFRKDGEKKILYSNWSSSDPNGVFNDYFDCPLPNSRKIRESPGKSKVPNQLVPVKIPIQLKPATLGKAPDDEPVKQVTKINAPDELGAVALEADQDSVSKVFFKKMKENEFVDMKILDSPKSPTTTTTNRGFVPQMDTAAFNFDENVEMGMENLSSPRMMNKKSGNLEMEADPSDDGGLNLWKWSLTGIGAICSFGIAAATICILFLGNDHRNKRHHQNQKIRFQIYNDDKRIKEVVHQATKLNEAISAVRGVPLTRAHVTFGGYYEGL